MTIMTETSTSATLASACVPCSILALARSSPTTPGSSFPVSRTSPPCSAPARSSSHYPPMSQPRHPLHSFPHSPPSPRPAASAVTPQLCTPARPSRARWHSSARSTLLRAVVTFLGGQRRRLRGGMRSRRGARKRELLEGVSCVIVGGECGLKRIWDRSIEGDALPSSLRGLMCVFTTQLYSYLSVTQEFRHRQTCTRSSL